MARRSGRCLTAFLIILTVTACAAAGEVEQDASSFATTRPVITTSTTSTTTTSTVPATTTSTTPSSSTTSSSYAGPIPDVIIPDGSGPFPAVVLVHGGGWVSGDKGIMAPLASFLADNGYMAVNTTYRLATRGEPSFPGAVEDVACAAAYAATHPASDGSVTIIGHSAGAHIGAIVALDGFSHDDNCVGPAQVDRFVGLAGPYDSSRLGFAMLPFFGVPESSNPELWDSGNPQRLTDSNPGLDSLIMYGDEDGIVSDDFAIDFAAALTDSGSTALLEVVEGARHNEMHDPDMVGDLILTWLDR